jgi:tricorn protease
MRARTALLMLFACALCVSAAPTQGPLGYYRYPAIHGDTIVFTAEGDLWTVGVEGGTARRLTSHPASEGRPAISPDGKTVAFSASYEGPIEVYTMPIEGGIPRRRTWDGAGSLVTGWTPDGRVLFQTTRFSGMPDRQLVALDIDSGAPMLVPLSQAADGVYDASGDTLFFTRLEFQGSHTKRYQGGTARLCSPA